MKVLLRSSFSHLSGYGRDGIGIALALLDRGHDVRISPSFVAPPLPREIAYLLTQPIVAPFDVALHHTEPEKAELLLSDAKAARVNVVWTMWGWPNLPDEHWVDTLAERTANFDHFVAYDPQSADAFAAVIGTDKLKTVLGGYTADDWSPPKDDEQPPPHRFTFGMNGRLTPRKGVYLAYQAYMIAKEEHGDAFDARLVLRSTEPVFPPDFPLPDGVEVEIAHSLPPELRRWYHGIDTLLCPSYAESKHLPPIEALACGTPVILSDIAGHRTWATPDLATFVPSRSMPIQLGYVGGHVTPENLASAMWVHYSDPQAQKIKAERAVRTLPAMLDWSRALERLGLATNLMF